MSELPGLSEVTLNIHSTAVGEKHLLSPHASQAKLVYKEKTTLQPTASNSLVASVLLVPGSRKQLLYYLNCN